MPLKNTCKYFKLLSLVFLYICKIDVLKTAYIKKYCNVIEIINYNKNKNPH